ncbi:hypothetical protein VTN77DRAFT_7673 [Rasamsonia byssochlamydoides]|uniref:uncharacterized protein n=1 Tax=Rasamsonia byssochlamydoides TaxID=89139 RepID=UPI0037449F36
MQARRNHSDWFFSTYRQCRNTKRKYQQELAGDVARCFGSCRPWEHPETKAKQSVIQAFLKDRDKHIETRFRKYSRLLEKNGDNGVEKRHKNLDVRKRPPQALICIDEARMLHNEQNCETVPFRAFRRALRNQWEPVIKPSEPKNRWEPVRDFFWSCSGHDLTSCRLFPITRSRPTGVQEIVPSYLLHRLNGCFCGGIPQRIQR